MVTTRNSPKPIHDEANRPSETQDNPAPIAVIHRSTACSWRQRWGASKGYVRRFQHTAIPRDAHYDLRIHASATPAAPSSTCALVYQLPLAPMLAAVSCRRLHEPTWLTRPFKNGCLRHTLGCAECRSVPWMVLGRPEELLADHHHRHDGGHGEQGPTDQHRPSAMLFYAGL